MSMTGEPTNETEVSPTVRFGELAIGAQFWLGDQEYIKRELRGCPGQWPYNACAPDEGKPWAWIGDEIRVYTAVNNSFRGE